MTTSEEPEPEFYLEKPEPEFYLEDDSLLEDELPSGSQTIDYELHLADEEVERVKRLLADAAENSDDQSVTYAVGLMATISRRISLLEGTREDQKKDTPKPAEESWSPEQRERFSTLKKFTDETNEQLSGILSNW